MTPEAAAHKSEELAAQLAELPNEYITLPTQITFPDHPEIKIVQISSGTKQNFAVSSEGKLFAWGYGNVGQLGLGGAEEVERPKEVKSKLSTGVDGIQNFKVLSCSTGGQHSLALAVRND